MYPANAGPRWNVGSRDRIGKRPQKIRSNPWVRPEQWAVVVGHKMRHVREGKTHTQAISLRLPPVDDSTNQERQRDR